MAVVHSYCYKLLVRPEVWLPLAKFHDDLGLKLEVPQSCNYVLLFSVLSAASYVEVSWWIIRVCRRYW